VDGIPQRGNITARSRTWFDLGCILRALPPTLSGLRDTAILLVGFADAFRRSELVALDIRRSRHNGAGVSVTEWTIEARNWSALRTVQIGRSALGRTGRNDLERKPEGIFH
jgi:hypothetical protein